MKGWEGCHCGLADTGQGSGGRKTASPSSGGRRLVFLVVQIVLKGQKGLVRRSFQFQDLPGTNKIHGIGAFFYIRTRIEQENRPGLAGCFLVLLFDQQGLEFAGKSNELTEIQGTEIIKKVRIDEFLVHSKALDGDLFLSVIVYENLRVGGRRFQGTIVQSIL